MIQKFKLKDLEETAKVYLKGLKMEIPPGKSDIERIISNLTRKGVYTFVYKENNKVEGLVSFSFKNKSNIQMKFICVMKLRKGIGKKLMKKLKNFAIKNKVNFIYSNVSSLDKRVTKFYENLGFKTYSKYYASRNFLLYRIKVKSEEIKV